MSRLILDEVHIHPVIRGQVSTMHADIVNEVRMATQTHAVVVVGMAHNPECTKARKILNAASIAHHYLEYGNYFGQWRRRNALKMWTGWPTFPMVFVKGVLVGGAADLRQLAEGGELQRLL